MRVNSMFGGIRSPVRRLWEEIKRESSLLAVIGVVAAGIMIVIGEAATLRLPFATQWITDSIQLFAGNWPSGVNRQTLAFAFLVTFRIMLVVGAVSGAWLACIRVRDLVEIEKMKLAELLAIRDMAIETAVLQIFDTDEQDQYRERVSRAVKTGASNWRNLYLRHLVKNEEELRQILRQVPSEDAVTVGKASVS